MTTTPVRQESRPYDKKSFFLQLFPASFKAYTEAGLNRRHFAARQQHQPAVYLKCSETIRSLNRTRVLMANRHSRSFCIYDGLPKRRAKAIRSDVRQTASRRLRYSWGKLGRLAFAYEPRTRNTTPGSGVHPPSLYANTAPPTS